jgi:WD40 repeat protein/tRNA A-37 threonylcarbamoyl transferase component Bud32
MKQELSCPSGHRWECDLDEAVAPGQQSKPVCPQCGSLGTLPSLPAPVPSLELPAPPTIAPATRSAPSGTDSTMHAAASVPGYEIEGELGRGGMGVVYRARQVKAGRSVALKMILSGAHAGSGELARFVREAEVVARLTHPNIVPVFEVGEYQGLPFFSMELVSGGSLDRRIAGTPQPPQQAATLVEKLARAVQAAHEAGVIHRDLKPANVLLVESSDTPLEKSTPKVTDFGLAKRLDQANGPTQSGDVMGTPSYMAPEQARGLAKSVGPAADVYALGAILYELLTGRPPFRGATALDTLQQVVAEDPVAVRRLNPQVPRDLETICLECLRKEPPRRYTSAAKLADDLGRFLAGEPVVARPVGALERAAKWAKRRPAVAGLSAFSLLLAVAGFALVTWQWRVAVLAREAAAHQRGLAEEAEERAIKKARNEATARQAEARARRAETTARKAEEQARAEAVAELYRSNLAFAYSAWLDGDSLRALELLNESPAEHRLWEWHHVRRQLDSGVLTLVGDIARASGVAFGPGAKLLAVGCPNEKQVKLYDQAGSLRRELTAGQVEAVAFSADGGRLAASGPDGAIHLWDPAGKKLRTLWHPGGVTALAFSPGGRRLASAGADKTVRLWDLEQGKAALTFRGHKGQVACVAFSPDGKRVASGALMSRSDWRAATLRVWDASSGKETVSLQGIAGAVFAVAFSPDGKHLAASGVDPTIRIFDSHAGGPPVLFMQGHRSFVVALAYEPGGTRLASGSWDQTVRVWNPREGRELFRLRGHQEAVTGLSFAAGRLATAGRDGVVKVFDPSGPQGVTTVNAPLRAGVAFSSDGRRAFTVGGDGDIHTWDVEAGKAGRALPVPAGLGSAATGVTLSRDGKYLAAAGPAVVKVWETATGKPLLERKVPEQPARARAVLGFSPDGARLAWAAANGSARVWEVLGGGQRLRLDGSSDVQGASLALSADARLLAVLPLAPATVQVWDLHSGKRLLTLPGEAIANANRAVAFSACGRRLAVAGQGARLWEIPSGRQLLAFTGHGSGTTQLAFSPDGKRLASAGADRSVKVWDTGTGQPLLSLEVSRPSVAGPPFFGLAFSPCGRRLAAAAKDGLTVWDGSPTREVTRIQLAGSQAGGGAAFSPDGRWVASLGLRQIRVWDRATGRSVLSLPWGKPATGLAALLGSMSFPCCVAFSPAGKVEAPLLLAAGGTGALPTSGELRLWDARDGRLVRTLTGHGGAVFGITFSPDGRRIASASNDKTARVWDVATGKVLATFSGHTDMALAVAFHPSGRLVASGGRDKTVRLWDAATGKPGRVLTGHTGGVIGLAFSPGGRRLASTAMLRRDGQPAEVIVWDVDSGKRLITTPPHTGDAMAVVFSRDGKWLASIGSDHATHLWDASSGKEILVLRGHLNLVRRLAISPDGRFLATASQDRTVRVWDVSLPAVAGH